MDLPLAGETKDRLARGGRVCLFVHGIPFRYVPFHYPVLTASRKTSIRSREQLDDARHLIEQFGFEPVHFLRPSNSFPLAACMESCFHFGDTLLFFNTLPFPRLQLSAHEWGVREVDMRNAYFVVSREPEARTWFQTHLPGVPFALSSDVI